MTELTLKEMIEQQSKLALNSHFSATVTFQRILNIIESITTEFDRSNIELLSIIRDMILLKLKRALVQYHDNGYSFDGKQPKTYDERLTKIIQDYAFNSYAELLSVYDAIKYIDDSKLGLTIAIQLEKDFLHAMGWENVEWVSNASDVDKHFIREIGTTFQGAFRNVLDELAARKDMIWKLKLKEFTDVSGLNYNELEKLIGSNIATVHLHVINGDLCFNLERNQGEVK